MSDVLNRCADDVLDMADDPDHGMRDAINLVVNATLHRLFDDPEADLSDVVTANYGDETTVADVAVWVNGG